MIHFSRWCHCLVLLLLTSKMISITQAQTATATNRFAIVLHGGAGGELEKWSEEQRKQRRNSLSTALEIGTKILSTGGTALDAVEAVVITLEDDPIFNAGRGCVLNERGEHELDASIMDGNTLNCGAVAGVKRVKNPIALARRVMTDTRHVLLTSPGADDFAERLGLPVMDASYFKTPEQIEAWKGWKKRQDQAQKVGAVQGAGYVPARYLGTVGCVAIDMNGNIAAGTSTGGLMGKRWGRIGDSPIIGAGTYASNATCGVSCTGVGEEFIRHNVAADMSARLRYTSQSLSQAAATIIDDVLPVDCGGLIAIDKDYNIVTHFNTPVMARAMADSTGRRETYLAREANVSD